jgi:hypothetical protein
VIGVRIETAESRLSGWGFSEGEDGNESGGAKRQGECGFHAMNISRQERGTMVLNARTRRIPLLLSQLRLFRHTPRPPLWRSPRVLDDVEDGAYLDGSVEPRTTLGG